MKKAIKTVLPIVGATAAAAAAAVYMIAPAKADGEKAAPFMGANIAHRGLHKADRSVPENSLAAFRAAVDSGYGIELDVRMTGDGHLVVFHDDNTLRMCGVDASVEELSLAALGRLRLAGTEERIPSLGEVLAVIDGQVPVIFEVKRSERSGELCRRLREMLLCYRGEFCVESFDPLIVRWWYKNAPEILRGQLSTTAEKLEKTAGRAGGFFVGNLLSNFLCRPNFIAYGLGGKKPLALRLAAKMGAMSVGYTSHGYEAEEEYDCVIFEYYRPRPKFK